MLRQRRYRTRTRGGRATAAVCVLASVLAASAASAGGLVFARDDSGSELAREAVSLCMRAAATERESEREALLEQGLTVAERAVAASERDAKAHFAVFCNLGRQVAESGASLACVSQVKRLRAEIDRTLALEPHFVDALAAKGAMLVRLPSLLGGDEDEGERLLRRAVELAPEDPATRLELAKALAEKGDDDAALQEANTVLALAKGAGAPEASEARELAHALGS